MTGSFAARVDRARALMAEDGLDALLLSVGSDLPYLTGYEAMPLERLTMAVVPRDGMATLVVPRLEAPRVGPQPDVFSIHAWDETEDPVAIVAGLAAGAGRVAIGDQTWAVFLLRLQELLPKAEFVPVEALTAELRMRKDGDEVEALRTAGSAADRVVARLRESKFSGRTERDLARAVEAQAVEEGHDKAWSAIVASGPNGASPHHESGERVMAKGDAVVIDFGGSYRGYHSDTTRTFHIGEPDDDFSAAFAVLREAQDAAIAAVRPGVSAASIDGVARSIIDAAGYGEYFVHRTGHGIGLEVHEHPYLVEGNDQLLEEGMAFSVEPGIYVPGRFGMRIEDIVVVTGDGADRLNRSPRDLAIVQ